MIGNALAGLLGRPGSNQAVMAQLLSGLVGGSAPVPQLGELRFEDYQDPLTMQYLGDLEIERMSPTELRNILMNPDLDQAQFESLASLGETAETGMSAIDRARLNEIQAQQASQARGARESILAQARQRGMGGSGMELAAQLQAQQDASNLASTQGMQVAAAAEQARREAALQRAGLASQMQSNQFGREATMASAQDAINQFNTANTNVARERNLGVQQGLANVNTQNRNMTNQLNTGLRNQATQYNIVQRPLAQYGMQSGQAQVVGQGLANAGQMQNQNSLARYQGNVQLAGAALGAAGGAAGAWLSDRRQKENISRADMDIEKFLSDLVPYRYQYKERTGQDTSPRVGIMAQDLERNPIGSELVNETSEGKTVDLMEAIPKVLASLGYLNQKIEDMK